MEVQIRDRVEGGDHRVRVVVVLGDVPGDGRDGAHEGRGVVKDRPKDEVAEASAGEGIVEEGGDRGGRNPRLVEGVRKLDGSMGEFVVPNRLIEWIGTATVSHEAEGPEDGAAEDGQLTLVSALESDKDVTGPASEGRVEVGVGGLVQELVDDDSVRPSEGLPLTRHRDVGPAA